MKDVVGQVFLKTFLLIRHSLSFFATEVEKLWKATNAKQKQIAIVCNNNTQILKNSVELVGNKATNHGRYFI